MIIEASPAYNTKVYLMLAKAYEKTFQLESALIIVLQPLI